MIITSAQREAATVRDRLRQSLHPTIGADRPDVLSIAETGSGKVWVKKLPLGIDHATGASTLTIPASEEAETRWPRSGAQGLDKGKVISLMYRRSIYRTST